MPEAEDAGAWVLGAGVGKEEGEAGGVATAAGVVRRRTERPSQVCVCERERERESVCERERERESVCVCVLHLERYQSRGMCL